MDPIIELKDVTKVYQMGVQEVRALDGVSVSIFPNEYVAIMGPSGSGKSTMMNVLGCLDTPSSGSYVLKGRDVSQMTDDQLAAVRNREIGFVFQTFNLLPRVDCLQNVELPLIYSGLRKSVRRRQAEKALAKAFAIKSAPAVALLVNSPGGSPVQSKLIHDRVRALAAQKDKKVLVFCEDVAASGGYMIACAGDEIYCDASSLLGSIGVISASFGFHEALGKLGIERRIRTAGENKMLADPFSPQTEEQKQRLERLMGQVHRHFIDLVKTRRGDKLSGKDDLFTGEVYTGDEAVEEGLADALADPFTRLRELYGEDVRLKTITPPQGGPLSRLLGQSAEQIIGAADTRAAWGRFGL